MNLDLPELRSSAPCATPLALDYRRMVAILGAAQAASPTAAAEAAAPSKLAFDDDPAKALVALLSGSRLQQQQLEALGGSFSPDAARHATVRAL